MYVLVNVNQNGIAGLFASSDLSKIEAKKAELESNELAITQAQEVWHTQYAEALRQAGLEEDGSADTMNFYANYCLDNPYPEQNPLIFPVNLSIHEVQDI